MTKVGANCGGRKVGGGRPKGALAKKTIMRLETRVKAEELGLTPLEVMLAAMTAAFQKGDLKNAHYYARDAAPYIHPRLAAVSVSGDQQAPVVINLQPQEFEKIAERLLKVV